PPLCLLESLSWPSVSSSSSFASFFLVLRPPRGSTLFPYTTLFRSCPRARPGPRCNAACARPAARRRPPSSPSGTSARSRSSDRADRKSTRLNSSHVKISYAVFCLKKKKKHMNHEEIDTTHRRVHPD